MPDSFLQLSNRPALLGKPLHLTDFKRKKTIHFHVQKMHITIHKHDEVPWSGP
jgi:hypothetical protein